MKNTNNINCLAAIDRKKIKLTSIQTILILLISLSIAACNDTNKDTNKIARESEQPKEKVANVKKEPLESKQIKNLTAAQKAWLKTAQLGPYAPKTQDWKAIEAAAKKEGTVIIYSVSSRIFKIKEKFKQKYGIEIIAYDTPSDFQLEKLRNDLKQGNYQVDVLFNSDIAEINSEFLPNGLVWNFVPDTVANDLNPNEKSPILVQRWTSQVLIYNNKSYPDGEPIDNLWDLTKQEWQGKFVLPDPLSTIKEFNVIQTILQHPKEMAAAYETEFGKKLTISPELIEITRKNPLLGPPNAATEWLYRLLKNKPVFTDSTDAASNDVGYFKEPIGMTTFSKMRWVERGKYQWQPLYNVKPVFGVSYPTVLTIADRAPHPNAAKLLIRFMMEEGFEPWNVPGDYAARQTIMERQVKQFKMPAFDDLNMWSIDPDYVHDTKYSYVTLYRLLLK